MSPILGSTIKTAKCHIWKLDFHHGVSDSKDRSRSAISTAYVSARENTVMHIRTFGKSSITAAYVPARENTAYPIPLSTELNLGRPNP